MARPSPDVRLREALRRAESPAERLRLLRERERAGEQVLPWVRLQIMAEAETAPRQRFRLLLDLLQALSFGGRALDYTRDFYGAQVEDVNERAMAALRRLHKRIKRSKRRDLDNLAGWAAQVVGEEAVAEVLAPFLAERGQIIRSGQAAVTEIHDRRRLVERDLARTSWQATPRRGEEARQFRFVRTSTFSSGGFSAGYHASQVARDDAVLFLLSQGFPAHMEHEPGEARPSVDWRGRSREIRIGDGFRVDTRAREPLDVEILRWRQRSWQSPDLVYEVDNLFDLPEEIRRDYFLTVLWDPREPQPRDCCKMTPERMEQIVAERGPLRPSWLPPELQWTEAEQNPATVRSLIARAKKGDQRAQARLVERAVREGRLGERTLQQLAAGCDAVALSITGEECGEQALLATAGRKTRFDGEQAEAVIRAYYRDKGWKSDPRSRGRSLISRDGKTKIMLRPRSWRKYTGGRGKWKKVGSGSKIKLAEKLVREART